MDSDDAQRRAPGDPLGGYLGRTDDVSAPDPTAIVRDAVVPAAAAPVDPPAPPAPHGPPPVPSRLHDPATRFAADLRRGIDIGLAAGSDRLVRHGERRPTVAAPTAEQPNPTPAIERALAKRRQAARPGNVDRNGRRPLVVKPMSKPRLILTALATGAALYWIISGVAELLS